MKAKSVLFVAANQVAVDQVEIPDPAPGEVIVRAEYSCISSGTELRCLAGKQEGSEFPFIPGYSQAGVIVRRGANTTIKEGTRVYCKGTLRANVRGMWGGHVAYTVQRESGVFPLPEQVDLLDASIIKLAAIPYHGLRHSRPLPHETVIVVGLGPIGQFAARLHTLTGARVVGFDTLPDRVQVAQQAGVEAVCVNGDLVEACRSVFPKGADVIVDTTGVPSVLPQLIRAAKDIPWDDSLTPGPRYLIQGSYAGDFTIPYQAAFLKEMEFLLPRDDQPRDARAIIDLMARGLLKVRDVISEVQPPECAPSVYADLQARRSNLLTAAFRWGEGAA